jgi:hypothetical protein
MNGHLIFFGVRGLLVGDLISYLVSLKDSPVNGTSAPVFRLMSDS